MSEYYEKYLKYKNKYINLKTQMGGDKEKIFLFSNDTIHSNFSFEGMAPDAILEYFKDKIMNNDILHIGVTKLIDDNIFSQLIEALKQLKHKEIKLILYNYKITNNSILKLGQELNSLNLISLDLFLPEWNTYDLSTIADALKKNTTLTTLTIKGVNDTNARKIADALKSNNTLTTLELIGSSMHQTGRFGNLEEIKLKISDEGAKAIADALTRNKTLQKLNLSTNQITDIGCKAIADAFKINNTLQKLNLYSNEITHIGANYLLNVIINDTNNVINRIDLDENDIDNYTLNYKQHTQKNGVEINISVAGIKFKTSTINLMERVKPI